jgi:uncharacterized membrane protein
VLPGLLLGVGLGGFVDGIVLHQVLQWHHMLSHTERYPTTTLAGLQGNTVADGLFHAFSWLAVVGGLLLLWRRLRGGGRAWSRWSLIGLMLAGWGLFNLVEGIVDHHILQVHHVREGPYRDWYDLGFLALGALLLLAGWAIHRSGQRSVEPAERPVTPVGR